MYPPLMQFEATAKYSEEGENSMSLVRVLTIRATALLSVPTSWNDVLITSELRLKLE